IYRTIFAISAIPAIISVIIGQVFVKETKTGHSTSRYKQSFLSGIKSFDLNLKFFIIVSCIFAFANFNISFFILKAKDTGIADTNVILLYVLYNILYSIVSYPFGIIADRIGRDKVIMIGFAIFIFTALGFAYAATSLTNIIILFALLGVY